jgi:hypothetical protein
MYRLVEAPAMEWGRRLLKKSRPLAAP